jgi:hypothetical protein
MNNNLCYFNCEYCQLTCPNNRGTSNSAYDITITTGNRYNTGVYSNKGYYRFDDLSNYRQHKDVIISKYPFTYYVFKKMEQQYKCKFKIPCKPNKQNEKTLYSYEIIAKRNVFKQQSRKV